MTKQNDEPEFQECAHDVVMRNRDGTWTCDMCDLEFRPVVELPADEPSPGK